jgi:hypothetical protein
MRQCEYSLPPSLTLHHSLSLSPPRPRRSRRWRYCSTLSGSYSQPRRVRTARIWPSSAARIAVGRETPSSPLRCLASSPILAGSARSAPFELEPGPSPVPALRLRCCLAALLPGQYQSRIDVLAGLASALVVGATALALSGQRNLIATLAGAAWDRNPSRQSAADLLPAFPPQLQTSPTALPLPGLSMVAGRGVGLVGVRSWR